MRIFARLESSSSPHASNEMHVQVGTYTLTKPILVEFFVYSLDQQSFASLCCVCVCVRIGTYVYLMNQGRRNIEKVTSTPEKCVERSNALPG